MMPKSFKSDYEVDKNQYKKPMFIEWSPKAPYLTLAICRERSLFHLRTRAVTLNQFLFDTGADQTALKLQTAESIGLDLSLAKDKSDLDIVRLATESYWVGLVRTVHIQIGREWIELQTSVPMKDSADWHLTRLELVTAGKLPGASAATQFIRNNLLGFKDLLPKFLICLERDGVYLFPRRTPFDPALG